MEIAIGIKINDLTTAADFIRSVRYAITRPINVEAMGTTITQIAVLESTWTISGIVKAQM
jgi:hypothetical protein